MSFLDHASEAAQELVFRLEGEWRWYVIAVIIILITLFVLKFIFRTLKWFIVALLIGLLLIVLLSALAIKAGIG